MEKEELLILLKQFSLKGFRLTIHSEGRKIGLALTKEDCDTILNVSFFINSVNEVSFFSCRLILKKIEEIVSPILRKSRIIGGKKNELMITLSFSQLENDVFKSYFSEFYYKLENKQNTQKLLSQFKEFILTIAEPFHQKWRNINKLNKFLDHLPQQEVSLFLGQGGTFKKALVFKLCCNPKFDDYFKLIYDFYTNRYKENPDGDILFKQWNDVAIAMKEKLENLPDQELQF